MTNTERNPTMSTALCYVLRWCQMPEESGSRLALHREYCTHRRR